MVLEKVHWQLPRRRCGGCQKTTTAVAPHAQTGSVVYGPNINAAAILFTRAFQVPWTNNASEQALKGPKRHQAVSGYWHSLATLARYCRVRSYLVTSRNHGIRPIDAIHAALTGRRWLPAPVSA